MLSSHNFFKHSEMVEEKEIRKIETNYVIKKKEPIVTDEEGEEDIILTEFQKEKMAEFMSEVNQAKMHLNRVLKKERDKFFSELRKLKAEVLENARVEGEKIKKEGYQAGLTEGQLDGYESGLENGYQAGLEDANVLKKNALKVIDQATAEMAVYQKEKQHEFIELSSIMAEKILHKELSLSEPELKVLLEPVLNKLEKGDNFITIFVTKSNQESTKIFMESLKETYTDMKYVVLVDNSLEKNGCVIETNYELIDLQLKKQLDSMVKDLLNGELK